MRHAKLISMAALLLASLAVSGGAQAQYQPYANPALSYYPVPAAPPSWSYDPYTSGLTACPQRTRKDPPCSETLFPTYGQPDYRR
jgi:hypothetical protein